jgi:hypothetical protein
MRTYPECSVRNGYNCDNSSLWIVQNAISFCVKLSPSHSHVYHAGLIQSLITITSRTLYFRRTPFNVDSMSVKSAEGLGYCRWITFKLDETPYSVKTKQILIGMLYNVV